MTNREICHHLKEIDDRIASMCREQASRWFAMQCEHLHTSYYLYYKPSTSSEWGELTVAEDPPSQEWKLADPQRIGPNLSSDGARRRMKEICRQLPLLPIS